VQVNVQCPSCNSQYQLNPEMIGQKIRCPNAACRHVFEVKEAPVPKPRAPKPKPVSDRRAPTFEGGAEVPHKAKAPAETGPREADWSSMPPPPVRRREPEPEPEPAPAAAAGQMSADEVLAWMNAPAAPAAEVSENDDHSLPAEATSTGEDHSEAPAADETDYAHLYAQPKRRWMRYAIIGMFVVAILGGVGFMVIKQREIAGREGQMARDAEAELEQNRLGQAQKKYDDLFKQFEKSPDRSKYKFLSEYAAAVDNALNGSDPPVKRRRDFDAFVQSSTDDSARGPWIEVRNPVVWQTNLKLLNDQVNVAQKAMNDREFDTAQKAVDDGLAMAASIDRRGTSDVKAPANAAKEKLQSFTYAIAEDRAYTAFVAKLKEALKTLTPVVVAEYEVLAKQNRYENRPEVVTEIQKAKDELKKRIVFKLDEKPAQQAPKSDLPLVVVGAARANTPAATERVVFAVARGVLYALTETTGQILWATRVGIDVATLPVRIRRAQNAPELVLVPTADGKGLVARDVLTGKAAWLQTLEAPMRGQPVLVQSKAFVPLADADGTIVLVETFDGSRVGSMKLGQRIGPGGAWQTGTSRLFVAADSQNIFVIDTNPKPDGSGVAPHAALEAVLPTGHGAGTLRGEPVVIGGATDESGVAVGTSYLILAQADGLDGMVIRAFELALPRADVAQPVEFRLKGWSWFTPTCDQEKLAIATDAGVFTVFGVVQKGGEDKALFPLVTSTPPPQLGRRGGRSQVIHSDDRNFWHLTNGELSMSRLGYDRKDGQRLAPGWKQSLRLGTPLHASQVSAAKDVLFVVTQTSSPPGCFATAVDAQTGAVRWQRALGVSLQGESLKLGRLIYQMDQGGGLYQLDAAQVKLEVSDEWTAAGTVLTPPRIDVVGEPQLLLSSDGKSGLSLVVVRESKGTHQLLIRQIVPDQPVKEHPTIALGQEMLAGPPALVGETLFLPLSSGKLSRLAVGTANLIGGPDWKTAALGGGAQGYVLPLAGDELLVSNGVRGLSVFAWPASGFQFKRQATTNNRLIAPPIAVPVEKGTPRIAIADSAGQVQLLDGDSLAPILTWNVRQLQLGTEVTGGPHLLGRGPTARILIIVDRTNLVCLASETRLPVWKYRVKGDGLAELPQVIDDALVLSDLSGRFEAINAATGAPIGTSFPVLGALPAAPTANPLDGGDGKLYAPLSDGSLLVIPRESLVPKKN